MEREGKVGAKKGRRGCSDKLTVIQSDTYSRDGAGMTGQE